ncbi:MAG TPA: hypothetical protein DCQ29_07915 [Chitinophagaceae bacterium]|nr:hypothetical protein [Chitinophagaceae bacterium]
MRKFGIIVVCSIILLHSKAQNLLQNSNFESFSVNSSSYMVTNSGNATGLPGQWQLSFSGNNFPACTNASCGVTFIDNSTFNSSNRSLKIEIHKHTNRNDIRLFQSIQNVPSQPSQFVVKFAARSDISGAPLTVNVFKSTEIITSNGACNVASPCQSYNLTTGWRVYKMYVDLSSWTAAERNNMRISIRPNTNTATPSGPFPKSFWIDDVTFEVVNPATELKDIAIDVANERRTLALNANFTAEADSIAAAITALTNATIALPPTPIKGVGFNPPPIHTTPSDNPYIASMHNWAANYLTQSFNTFPKTTTTSIFARNFDGRSLGYVLENLQWLLLSPLSRYQYNPELFRRFLTIIYATSDDYIEFGGMDNDGTPGSNIHPLNDWFAAPMIAYGWGIADRCFQNYIPSVLLNKIRGAADTMGVRHYNLGFQIDDYLYTNRDISYAEILTNVGFHRNNNTYINLAKRIIDSTHLVSLYPDGAYSYWKYQNEVTNYHGGTNNSLAKIWSIIEYQPAWECVSKSAMFEILSVEPKEVPEFYTAGAWKTMWNGSTGCSAEPLVTISRNPFLKTKLQETRDVMGYTDELPLAISFYDSSVPTMPLPDNYLVYDRNIQGPRARYGRFSYGATGRNVALENSRDPGLQTIVGAMITQPGATPTVPDNLNAALMAVHSKVHIRRGNPEMQWTDWAYMMSSVTSRACVGKTVSSISAVGGLQRQSSGPLAFESNWASYQHWITLPDRIIGIVETYPKNNSTAQAFEIDGRVRFTFGRGAIRLPKFLVTEVPEQSYSYGAFKAIVHGHDFDSVLTDTAGIVRDDFRNSMEIIFRHNLSNGTTLFTYPSSTRKFFIVEIRDSGAVGNATVTRFNQNQVRGLVVRLNGKVYASYRNDSTVAVNVNVNSVVQPGNTNQLLYGRRDAITRFPTMVTTSTIQVPANNQVLLISTNTPALDTGRGWNNMPELLNYTASNVTLPIRLNSFNYSITDCKVSLNWLCKNDKTLKQFEIEKSVNGRSFVKVYTVPAKCDSNICDYSLEVSQLDKQARYRIKLVGINGKITYSQTLSVIKNCDAADKFTVYPNPVTSDEFVNIQYVYSGQQQEALLRIFDKQGRELTQKKVIVTAGANNYTLAVQGLRKGLYFLRLQLIDGTVKEVKLMVGN